jgi:beta-glucosidase
VVQLYGVVEADDFPRRVLLGFAPVSLAAGASATVTVNGSIRPLLRWTGDGFAPAASTVLLEAAAYSGDPAATTVSLHL